MVIEDRYISKGSDKTENFVVQLTDPMLYDRMRTLSAEYSVSEEFLVNVAVSRMISDIDFVRSLRRKTPVQ